MSRTKALQIVLVVIAGGLAGAGLMKVLPRPKAPEAGPSVAAVETPAPKPVEKPAETVTPPAPKPDPFVEPRAATSPATSPAPLRVPRAAASRRQVMEPLHRPNRPLPERPVAVNADRTPVPIQPPAPARAVTPLPATPPQESRTLSSGLQRRGPVETAPPSPPARPEPEQVTPVPPAEPKPVPPPAPVPVEPHRVTLNAGTLISVRLVNGLSTERNRPGDAFTAALDHELIGGEFVIAERGARVDGRVVGEESGGRTMTVSLTYLYTSDGQTVPIRTDAFSTRGPVVPRDARITFRLGVPVRLTERTQ